MEQVVLNLVMNAMDAMVSTPPAQRHILVSTRASRGTVDVLGDLVEEHLDTDALGRLIEGGAPAGLPMVLPGLR